MLLSFNHKKAFTLIELMVVVSIIGLLSSVVLSSLNTARAKARDARRRTDLDQIRTALILYYDKYGNWIPTGSGCGSGGNGNGWFNHSNGVATSYPKAISACLKDEGFTPAEIRDPLGGTTSNPTTGFAYMKYSCGSPTRTYIFSKMETLDQSTTATDGTCCASCDSSYGMNYYVKVE